MEKKGQKESLCLILAILCVFSPCLFNGYVYDDFRFIKDNPFMEKPLDLKTIFMDPGAMETLHDHDIYRPLRTLFFHLESNLNGETPFFSHLVGLLIHLMSTLLLLRILRALLSNGFEYSAFWGALLFGIHPVQVESVAWISSRGDQLFCLFALLTLICCFKGRTPLSLLGSLIFSFLACLSKESGVMTCALIFLLWVCFKRFRTKTILLHSFLALITAAIYLLMRASFLGELQGQAAPYDQSILKNFFYACFGVVYQGSLIFRPWFSNVDYPPLFFVSISFTQMVMWGLLFPLIFMVALFLIRKKPVVSFGLLFFFLAQLPTSSLVFPMKNLVNDRYLYLPMAGCALLFCLAIRPRRLRMAGCLLLIALAYFSFTRCLDWRSEETLWTATLKTHPKSVKARLGLGNEYFNNNDVAGGLKMAREAITLSQEGSSVRTMAALLASAAYVRLDNPLDAAQVLRQALMEADAANKVKESMPDILQAARNLWVLDMQSQNFSGAVKASAFLIDYGGETAEHLLLSGLAFKSNNKLSLAEEHLLKGVAKPDVTSMNHFALYELYMTLGKPQMAEKARQKGLLLQTKEKSPDPNSIRALEHK